MRITRSFFINFVSVFLINYLLFNIDHVINEIENLQNKVDQFGFV